MSKSIAARWGLAGALVVSLTVHGQEPHGGAAAPAARNSQRPEATGPTRGPKSFEPVGAPEGDEITRGTSAYLRKRFVETLPFAAGLDDDIRSTYDPATIVFIPTPDVKRTIHALFPQAPVGDDIDAMTVSQIVKRAATGKLEAKHIVFLKSDLFDDPAQLAIVLNHELLHVAGKEKAVRAGRIDPKSYAQEEVDVYTKSIASIRNLVATLKQRGDEASLEFTRRSEARLAEEQKDLAEYQRQVARERK